MFRNWIIYNGKSKLLDIFSRLRKNKYTVSQGAPLTLATVFVLKLSNKVIGVTTG